MPAKSKTDPGNGSIASVDIEEVEHTADVALCIRGGDLAELFTNGAKGITALMTPDPCPESMEIRRRIELSAMDAESLLVEWLSELAYLAESENLVFNRFGIQSISTTQLTADLHGWQTDTIGTLIKAVTYHDLSIRKVSGKLEATVIFDV